MSRIVVLALLLCGVSARAEEPRCVSNFGKTACGYHCVANYAQVKCAQTEEGVCTANYGEVVCWDPPRRGHRREHGAEYPRAQCLSNYGSTACGYACVANYGEVKCAQTPSGMCSASNGHVTCFDPR
ncbi:hypothetical protein JGU66_28190 [Myxococcaceae bacterium JPH2]|nr:hypothetical protein [Myxococcaceae bacterium JPH2]